MSSAAGKGLNSAGAMRREGDEGDAGCAAESLGLGGRAWQTVSASRRL